MREIEIKARVADKAALLEVLKRQNVILGEPVTQRDRVWVVKGSHAGDTQPVLRIRTETKGDSVKQILTLKKSVTNQMDSIEHETDIADEGELTQIIKHLEWFVPYSDSTKTRQKARLGNIEICVDSVDRLGDFIEVEKMTNEDADYDAVAEELWSVLEGFGVDRSDHVTDGYDVLLRKSEGMAI